MFWFVLYVVVFLLILSEAQFRWKYRSLNRIPGPLDIPFVGFLLHINNRKTFIRNLFTLIRRYGSIVKCSVGRQMVILTTDAEMIEFFLQSPKFTKKAQNYTFLKPWLKTGIFSGDGIECQKTRKLVTPAFHISMLQQHVTVFHSHCDVLMDILRKDVDSNRPIDIYPIVVNFTLDIITETAIGVKTNVQNNNHQEYQDAMHFMTDIIIERTMSLWKRFDFLFRFSATYVNQQKYLKILTDFSEKAIEDRKKLLLKKSTDQNSELLNSNLDGKKKQNIFLDILLNSTIDGKPLSDEKLTYEVNTLIFGGHDTLASAISLMMYELANNKKVQDKIVAELKEIYENDRDRPVSMQDMNELRYMDLVIKEVLRFYGVVPTIGRDVVEDVEYKGTIIPKGTTVGMFLYGLHMSPTLYENPNEFIPERILPGHSLKPFSYIPFSAGPRNCIGQKFAVYEIKVTFAKLLRYFEFESAGPNYTLELLPEVVMKAANGMYLKIKPRDF